jgi:hypothetical protein
MRAWTLLAGNAAIDGPPRFWWRRTNLDLSPGPSCNRFPEWFKTAVKVSTILDHIDSGHMALPEFQRGYVWKRDQVRGLFDSLYRQHPVGGRCFTETEDFKRYVQKDILALEAVS